GHTDWVRAVAVGESEGRPVVVSGSDDHTVRVWELATGAPVGDPFIGHTDWVRAVAVGESEGRPVVVSGSDDHTVRVWDLAKRRPVRRILRTMRLDHSSPVQATALYHVQASACRKDHLTVIAGCSDGAMVTWNLSTSGTLLKKHVYRRAPVNAIAVLGPDHVMYAASGVLTLIISPTNQDSAVALTIDLDADVLALALHSGSTLVAATRLGLVVLDLPRSWPP
ncbi:MAG: hypothetical protein ACRDTC_03125, partial [Pseudonocardiaceae bacterium]